MHVAGSNTLYLLRQTAKPREGKGREGEEGGSGLFRGFLLRRLLAEMIG